MKKATFGLNENIAGLLCYVALFFSGIVMLIMERENKFVRFHALQSTIWFIFLGILSWVLKLLSNIWFFGSLFAILTWLIGVATFASAVLLVYMAFKGAKFKLPIIGDVVEAQIDK